MGLLRLVDTNATTRINSDDGDWIEVRANLSKREVDTILASMPESLVRSATRPDGSEYTFDFGDSSAMARSLFGALMVGWSLDAPCTVENYLSLSSDAGSWIDAQLFTHFNSLQMNKSESGKVTSSPEG